MGMQEVTGGAPSINLSEIKKELEIINSTSLTKIVDGKIKKADMLDKVLTTPTQVTARAMEILKQLQPCEDVLSKSEQELIAAVAVKIGIVPENTLRESLERNVLNKETNRFENRLPALVSRILNQAAAGKVQTYETVGKMSNQVQSNIKQTNVTLATKEPGITETANQAATKVLSKKGPPPIPERFRKQAAQTEQAQTEQAAETTQTPKIKPPPPPPKKPIQGKVPPQIEQVSTQPPPLPPYAPKKKL